MTATGKITAARLVEGSRVKVSVRLTADRYEAIRVVYPSPTKKKNVHAATVQKIVRNPAGSSYESPGWVVKDGDYVRGTVTRYRRRSDFDLTVMIDGDTEPRVLHNVTPSQTFWLA